MSEGKRLAVPVSSSGDGSGPLGDCLSDDDVVAIAEAGFNAFDGSEREQKELHMADCGTCQELVAEACRALGSSEALAPVRRPSLLVPGSLLARRYRIERFLARGGMGEVYEVRDLELEDALLALKTVSASAGEDALAIRRLKSEVRLAQRVRHPHCCSVYHFGSHQDASGVLHFLTMEFVAGETLLERLKREGALPPAFARKVAEQLLDALAAAHSVGVLHRDFKSSNVMLKARSETEPPHAMIMDFGLARALDENAERLTTDQRVLIGSAAYMSPEQVLGERLTPASDVYAFGVVLFEMLTARLPFLANGAVPTALLRLDSPPPKPSSIIAGLSPAWDRLVLRCLERHIGPRFQSAEAVRAALQSLDTSDARPTAPPAARSAASVAQSTSTLATSTLAASTLAASTLAASTLAASEGAATKTLAAATPEPAQTPRFASPRASPAPSPRAPAANSPVAIVSTPLAPITPTSPPEISPPPAMPAPASLAPAASSPPAAPRAAKRSRAGRAVLGLGAIALAALFVLAAQRTHRVDVAVQAASPAASAPAPAAPGAGSAAPAPEQAPARAVVDATARASAERFVSEGRAQAVLGNWALAQESLGKAYALSADPELLPERASLQSRLFRSSGSRGDCEGARELYRQYLAQATPSEAGRARAERGLRELGRCVREAARASDAIPKGRHQIDPEEL